MSAFQDVPSGPPDPVHLLKVKADTDPSPDKVDLGVGVYRNEGGECHELGVIKKAKRILSERNPSHEYEVTTGNPTFTQNAAAVLFGKQAEVIRSKRLTSVQAISGTGAIHLAALFLSRCSSFKDKKVYVGTPAWGNYKPLFNLAGFEVINYRHYDPTTATVDFTSVLKAVFSAAEGSIFVLQGCCHNPTGADFTKDQWSELANAMEQRKVFPFFDMAYQGLGTSLDDDAFGLRLFTSMGFELVAAQSFSKNFGLYGERCGVTHVVCGKEAVARNVYDQLRSLIRWEFSSSPAYGSRLVNIILEDENLSNEWEQELASMQGRLQSLKSDLHEALVVKRDTPGDWSSLLSTNGLFWYEFLPREQWNNYPGNISLNRLSFLPLNAKQCVTLGSKYHIYMFENGRINISGANKSNIDRIASAIDEVARGATLTKL